MDRRQMEAYCGDLSQLFSIRECVLMEGKSKGTRAYQIHNGKSLDMLVLPDKCFAVPELRYKGINIGFISKSGICAPEFFQEEGTRGFLRNFEAGFLTTCGLTYMGTPEIDNGQANGLHGIISNTPAEHLYSGIQWRKGIPVIEFGGEVREGHLFGPNIQLKRKVTISTDEDKLQIHDFVENCGFETSPIMLLYHFNIGYPMLDESCRIFSNMSQLSFRDETAKAGVQKCNEFQKPEVGIEEEVYFRTAPTENKQGIVMAVNENRKLAVTVKFNLDELPILNHWKNPKAGDYGLGLEPGTCHVGGRQRAEKENLLRYIEPGERKEFCLEVCFSDNKQQIEQMIKDYTLF